MNRGAWSCRECAGRRDLGAGHGYADGGYCGVGQHTTRDRIEWFPDVEAVEAVDEEMPWGW